MRDHYHLETTAAVIAVLLLVPVDRARGQDRTGPDIPPEAPPGRPDTSRDPAGQEAGSRPDPRPWYRDVAPERRQRAEILLQEAADLAEQLLLGKAIDRYREALEQWDHPDIRFELADILDKAGRPLEAWNELQGLRATWGFETLTEDDRARAEELRRTLLRDHLAEIEVRCDVPGARVELDGELLFVGPGVERVVTLVGGHVLASKRDGYVPVVESVGLYPGEQRSMHLDMREDRVIVVRRWAPWKPWAVLGTGAALVAAGGVLQWRVSSNFTAFERAVQDCGVECAEEDLGEEASGLERRGTLQLRLSITSYLAGGALAATGLVLAYLNQPRVLTNPGEIRDTRARAWLIPTLSSNATGLSAGWHF